MANTSSIGKCRNRTTACFVKGCKSGEIDRNRLRLYKIPNSSHPFYNSFRKAVGHTEFCLKNAKPKYKQICARHFTDDINRKRTLPIEAVPTLHLDENSIDYFSKSKCLCSYEEDDFIKNTENGVLEGQDFPQIYPLSFVDSESGVNEKENDIPSTSTLITHPTEARPGVSAKENAIPSTSALPTNPTKARPISFLNMSETQQIIELQNMDQSGSYSKRRRILKNVNYFVEQLNMVSTTSPEHGLTLMKILLEKYKKENEITLKEKQLTLANLEKILKQNRHLECDILKSTLSEEMFSQKFTEAINESTNVNENVERFTQLILKIRSIEPEDIILCKDIYMKSPYFYKYLRFILKNSGLPDEETLMGD